jgi:hypothetical protein
MKRDLELATEPQAAARDIEPELEQLAKWLDDVFRIPGLNWRFGLDAIIGLIPGVGDTATSLASFYILTAATRYGVPKITLVRMALNIAIDYIVGAIPLFGDLFDFYWKANRRNVELLRGRARVPMAEARKAKFHDWLFVGLMIFLLIALLVGCVTSAWWVISTVGHWIFGGA